MYCNSMNTRIPFSLHGIRAIKRLGMLGLGFSHVVYYVPFPAKFSGNHLTPTTPLLDSSWPNLLTKGSPVGN